MKQKLLLFLLVLMGCGLSLRAQEADDFVSGNGERYDTPFLIETAEQLAALNKWTGEAGSGKYFRIVKDIDISEWNGIDIEKGWLPIGEYGIRGESAFSGFVDGGNHTVRGLWINRPDRNYVGLFGYAQNGKISNLTIEIPEGKEVIGMEYVGGLAGRYGANNTITHCRVISGGTVKGEKYVGGLIGFAYVNIGNCSSDVDVEGKSQVGGLIGYMEGHSISKSYSTGEVTTEDGEAGGLIGIVNNNTQSVAEWTLSDCYATGNISGKQASSIGGLIGIFSDGKHLGIRNSYATGVITTFKKDAAGGLIGEVTIKSGSAQIIISDCFYRSGMISDKEDKCIGKINDGVTINGNHGVAKSKKELEKAATYTDAGWESFGQTWYFPTSDSYPVLQKTIPLFTKECTADSPWEIASYPELVYLRDHYLGQGHNNKYFLLTADIDVGEWLAPGSWSQIGGKNTPFCGQFDGGGHKITGLLYRPSGDNHTGLFGYTLDAVIKNLTLEITDIEVQPSNATAGALVGYADGTKDGKGLISNCGVTGKGKISTANGIAGGLVGVLNVPMDNCYAEVAVEATSGYAGGLVGKVDKFGKIAYSYAGGNVSLQDGIAAGGLVGDQSGLVVNSFAYGGVAASGDDGLSIGGLIGVQYAGVENCYAIGRLKGTNAEMGGLIGRQSEDPQDISTTACFFDTQETGLKEPFGNKVLEKNEDCGITPLSTIKMIKDVTYIDTGWQMGGDEDTWIISINSSYPYPHFVWRSPEGWKQQYQEPVNTYYKVTLEVATGIYCNRLPGGDLIIAENDHLYLDFYRENSSGETAGILFMIDGEEVAFKETGNGGSYILNPIIKDHTIVIALREYSVVMPEVDGAQTDPVAGTYPVSYGEPFRFTINLNDLNGFNDLKVFSNETELTPVETRQTLSLQYTIDRITAPVTITIEGVNPTGNQDITCGNILIAIDNGLLTIDNESGQTTKLAIYTLTGHLYINRKLVPGTTRITLPQGVYIVRAGAITAKVVIR